MAVTSPLGRRSTTVYDLAGQVTASVDPLGNRTSYAYDNAGNQTSVTNPLGFITTSVYSASSNRMSASVDPLGNRTSYACDSVIAHHHAIIASELRGEINSVNLFLESNAEYGDARGGSYSVGEGQLTNGNYGEYELPGFPRDWNPFKRGEMPRLTPMPPYKKPPRKNPPPVEIIPPPRQPQPGPKPPRGGVLPGLGDTRRDIGIGRFALCLFCCAVKSKGMGAAGGWLPIELPIGDCVAKEDFVLPNVELPIELPKERREELCDGLREDMKKLGIIVPPEFCKSLFPEEDFWGKDFIEKLEKWMGKCNKVKCFVECGLEFNDNMNRSGQPDPWQLCGLRAGEEECQACCDRAYSSGGINHYIWTKCYQQCGSQTYY